MLISKNIFLSFLRKAPLLLIFGLVTNIESQAQIWMPCSELAPSDRKEHDFFGYAIDIHGTSIIAATRSQYIEPTYGPRVYIFEQREDCSWWESGSLTPSRIDTNELSIYESVFTSVALSDSFALLGIVTGEPNYISDTLFRELGEVYVFKKGLDGEWTEVQLLVPSIQEDYAQFSSSVEWENGQAFIGARGQNLRIWNDTIVNVGAIYIFEPDKKGDLKEKQILRPSDSLSAPKLPYQLKALGIFMDVSDDLMISAGYYGAYVFEKQENGLWKEVQKILPPTKKDDGIFFITSVAIYGEYLAIGSRFEPYDDNELNYMHDAGAVMVYQKSSSGQWLLKQKLTPSDRKPDDNFGNSVAMNETYLVVGAEDDADRPDEEETKIKAGSVYVYQLGRNGKWHEQETLYSPQWSGYDNFGGTVAVSPNYIVVGAEKEREPTKDHKWIVNSGAVFIFEW